MGGHPFQCLLRSSLAWQSACRLAGCIRSERTVDRYCVKVSGYRFITAERVTGDHVFGFDENGRADGVARWAKGRTRTRMEGSVKGRLDLMVGLLGRARIGR